MKWDIDPKEVPIINGLHDDDWYRNLLIKYPGNKLSLAVLHPERVSKKDVIRIAGGFNFEIIEKWFRANVCKKCRGKLS